MTRTAIRVGPELRLADEVVFEDEYTALRFIDFECRRRGLPNPTRIPLERAQERKP